jgi:hypothetical protein
VAYTHFAEVAEGRAANVDQQYQRSYTRVFLVRTNDYAYGPGYAASHPSIPRIWYAHPEDAKARCTSISPSQDQGDPYLWRITVQYAYKVDEASAEKDLQQDGQDPAERVENPLLRPRDYSVASMSYPWAMRYDRFGQKIANSAGDPFLPTVEIVKGGATITVGLNSLNAVTSTWISSIGKLNQATFILGPYAVGAGLAKLNSVSANRVFEDGLSYWHWTLVFEYRPDGWAFVLANVGKRERSTVKDQFIDIMSPLGGIVSTPVYLSAAGKALKPTDPPTYATYHVYPRIAFPSL